MKLFSKIFLFCFIFSGLLSCRSLDRTAYSNASNDPIGLKILPLKKSGFEGLKYEADEIDNICESKGPVYGQIVISGNQINRNKGGLSYFFPFPLLATMLLGSPLFISASDVQLECEIQNSRHERIAVFSSRGSAGVPCGLYYGYGPGNSSFKSIVDATKMANKGIRNQLTPEVVAEINKKLLEAGPIE
jgi:hypothetical protein